IGDRVFRNHIAVHTNAFAKRNEVRGRKQTGAISLCTADRIDHGANGAFAVCARDVNDLAKDFWRGACTPQTEFVKQTLDVFQAELDPEALEAVKPGERFLVC